MYRCGLRASYARWPITPLLLSHAGRVWIAVHGHPARREIAQSFAPAVLIFDAIE